MPKIILSDVFWKTAVFAAYELYNYPDPADPKKRTSAECLGCIWGCREGDTFIGRYAVTTQLIEHRDEGSVVGPDPFDHVLHNLWAVRDTTDTQYLGSFHSHPWSEQEVADWKAAGEDDTVFYRASRADMDSMANDTVEVIISCRPGTSSFDSSASWQQQGDVVTRRVDIADITISGWYRNDDGHVVSVPISIE